MHIGVMRTQVGVFRNVMLRKHKHFSPVAFIMMRFLFFECFQMFFTSSKHSIQLVEQLFFGAARSKFLYVPGELTFELGDLKIKVTSIAWFKIHPGG